MLLKGYNKKIFRPECNPSFQSLHCIAHLERDVTAVLPYLNAVLGGEVYIKEPPSVTFKVHGKLITVHARRIAINALKAEAEADRIMDWLVAEINEVWKKRDEIVPKFEVNPKPQLLDLLKLLPRTNCQECGFLTCTVFALRLAEGAKGAADCPVLTEGEVRDLETYLNRF